MNINKNYVGTLYGRPLMVDKNLVVKRTRIFKLKYKWWHRPFHSFRKYREVLITKEKDMMVTFYMKDKNIFVVSPKIYEAIKKENHSVLFDSMIGERP